MVGDFFYIIFIKKREINETSNENGKKNVPFKGCQYDRITHAITKNKSILL